MSEFLTKKERVEIQLKELELIVLEFLLKELTSIHKEEKNTRYLHIQVVKVIERCIPYFSEYTLDMFFQYLGEHVSKYKSSLILELIQSEVFSEDIVLKWKQLLILRREFEDKQSKFFETYWSHFKQEKDLFFNQNPCGEVFIDLPQKINIRLESRKVEEIPLKVATGKMFREFCRKLKMK